VARRGTLPSDGFFLFVKNLFTDFYTLIANVRPGRRVGGIRYEFFDFMFALLAERASLGLVAAQAPLKFEEQVAILPWVSTERIQAPAHVPRSRLLRHWRRHSSSQISIPQLPWYSRLSTAMLKPFAFILAVGLVIPSDICAQQGSTSAHTVLIRKNIALKLTLLSPLDTAKAKVGDDVPMLLARPLVVDGVTLLPIDDVLHGRVTKVKNLDKKCGYRIVDFDLKQISFADSTTAKTKVLFVSNRDVDVADNYSSHFTPSNIPGVAVQSLAMLPFDLILIPVEHFTNNCWPQILYERPADSTVAVVFRRDHRVRY
jgi:hypothetical protein